MSGFHLVPLAGGAPVHLPPGETVLGRGPFLRVSDKRVSRHHGLLENLNGRLRLKPTHMNPCFMQSSLTDDPRPLTRGSWYPLQDGDLFSLLPGQLMYQVVAVGEDADAARTEELRGNHRETPPHEEPTSAAPADKEEQEEQEDGRLNQEVEDDDDGGITASPVKTRVLPAWMMAAVAAPHSSSSSPKVQSKPAASKKATPTDSPEEAGLSEEEEERPRKKRRKNEPSDEPTVRHHSASDRSEVSEESDSFTEEVEDSRKGDSVTAVTTMKQISESEEDRKLKDEAESVGSKGNSVSAPAASKPRRRTPCAYGKDCYRKNPLHFQECSHPGDTDHEEDEDEDEDEERPECPYGTDCYRKNPQHRKDYKHTKRPARRTRTVPSRTATRHDDDDDEDHDSFINDDSEDMGEDSDWVPPDRDDSDEEDIRRLQREADVFLKKRK